MPHHENLSEAERRIFARTAKGNYYMEQEQLDMRCQATGPMLANLPANAGGSVSSPNPTQQPPSPSAGLVNCISRPGGNGQP